MRKVELSAVTRSKGEGWSIFFGAFVILDMVCRYLSLFLINIILEIGEKTDVKC